MTSKNLSQNTGLFHPKFIKNAIILFFLTALFITIIPQITQIKFIQYIHSTQLSIFSDEEQVSRVQFVNDASAYIANRKRDGHFHIDTKLPYSKVTMLVDTGATYITLKHEDALNAGLLRNVRYNSKVITANGSTKFGKITLDEITIGNFKLNNVKALIAPPGSLDVSLLGMSALSKIPLITMKNNQLILSR